MKTGIRFFFINFYSVIFCFFPPSIILAKTVLLTGGAGFIGSHVGQQLLERGDMVVVVDNFNDAYDARLKRNNIACLKKSAQENQLHVYAVDIRDEQALDALFEKHKPNAICHLAARAGVRVSLEIPEEYVTSNILGTLNIFKLAQKYGLKHVVYASSSSVYGDCEQGPFEEGRDVSHPISPYAMTKCACELLAYTYYHVYGIASTGLRFFTVYGPRGRVDMAPFIFMNALYHGNKIQVFGDGSAQRDFTYVADIAQGIIQALDTPAQYQVVNLGRGEPIILRDFIATMEKVVGKKADIQYQPVQVTDVTLTHAQISKAQELLGYEPQVSVEQGLAAMYDWYVNEYVPMICS
jgi:UDP-glucuronate 4-epimerase